MSSEWLNMVSVPHTLRFRMDYLVETTQEYHTIVVEAFSPEPLSIETMVEQMIFDLHECYESPIHVTLVQRGG